MEEILLDEVDYFLHDIEHFFLNTKSEKIFNSTNKHLFVGISPFNSYYSRNTIILLAKWCKKYSQKITFFYVGNLARHTLKILKPYYDEKKIQEKLKQQSRIVENRVTEALTLIGYTKEAYKTFEDIENNVYFIKNLEEILSIYKSDDNKLKNLIKNFFANTAMKVMEENIDSFYTYVLNELAIFKSIKNIFDTEEIFVVYHDLVSLTNLNTIQETFNHDINYLCVKINDKKQFINYFIDDADNVFILNKNFRYKYISKGMANRLGISENEAIHKTFFEIFGVENEEIKNNDKKVIFEGLTIETEEFINIDNKTKYFKVVKRPFLNEKNDIIGLKGSSMDITEIKEAQIKAEKERCEELEFNEKYIHELNNILHKQKQIKFLLNSSTASEEDGIILSEILEFENNKFFYITENFTLHNNYLSQGKEILLQKKLTNIIYLIEKEVVYFNLCYKYLNQNRLIIFERDLDDYVLMVDEVKISQLVHNLIKNADKHSESTEIKIKFKILEDSAVISIEDNGKGIDSHINKESLFIVDKDKKITKSGSGLGLPICKSIVNHHGGDIYFKDVESGTAIEFFLHL